MDATGGSIATVTNFGDVWPDVGRTPIPLPEQTLVLGMGAARRAPYWDAAQNAFARMMEANLTLSFPDHRAFWTAALRVMIARASGGAFCNHRRSCEFGG